MLIRNQLQKRPLPRLAEEEAEAKLPEFKQMIFKLKKGCFFVKQSVKMEKHFNVKLTEKGETSQGNAAPG